MADLKKGGTSRLVISSVTNGESIKIPKGFKIDSVITKKIGTTAGNFALGTTVGGVDVVDTVALGTVDAAIANQTLLTAVPFSMTADTTLYITATTGSCDAFVLLQKVN